MTAGSSLAALVDGCQEAVASLVDDLRRRGFGDADARRRSNLPGWTNGHVLAHIAGNADGMGRMVQAAAAGTVADMYASAEARAAAIDRGAGLPAARLLADLERSEADLQQAWRSLAAVEDAPARRWGCQPWPVVDLAFVRLREISVHTVDLSGGRSPDDAWSDLYVAAEFSRQLASLARRLPARTPVTITVPGEPSTVVYRPGDGAVGAPRAVAGTKAQIVAWMLERRAAEAGWPDLEPWDGIP